MPRITKLREPMLVVDSTRRSQVAAWAWLRERKLRPDGANYRLKVWWGQ